MHVRDLKPGTEISPLVKPPITKLQLIKYAGASGDFNLIHVDEATARDKGLDGVIAHGMLSMGFLAQLLTETAGIEQMRRMSVRFVQMVRLGDILTCRGVVKTTEVLPDGRGLICLEIWVENQRGERVTTGEGEIYLPVTSA